VTRVLFVLLWASFAGLLGPGVAGAREIRGSVLIRERIALPDEAQIVVAAVGWQDLVLAQVRMSAHEGQLPRAYSLQVPDGLPMRLRAAIVLDRRYRWTSPEIAIAPGADPVDLGTTRLRVFDPGVDPAIFRCAGTQVRILPDRAGPVALFAGTAQRLQPDPAAGQPTFSGPGPGGPMRHAGGGLSILAQDGAAGLRCQPLIGIEPDAAAGLGYTARGTEPGWSLVLDAGQLHFVDGYGATSLDTPMPMPQIEGEVYRMQAPQVDLAITIRPQLCHDAATAMPYPDRVQVRHDGHIREGCGGAPASLIQGRVWKIESLAGGGIVDRSRITLEFGADGTLSGSTGCNGVSGRYWLNGEGLSIAKGAAVTMMACSDALMAQEHRFLSALRAAARFDVDPLRDQLFVFDAAGVEVLRAIAE